MTLHPTDESTGEGGIPFGRYRLVRVLGRGGMGEVFLAMAHGAAGFRKKLVIKRILPELARDEAFVTRFLAEGKLVVQLHHPHIVQVLDMGDEAGEVFIAMEYVDGWDLGRIIDATRADGATIPLPLALLVLLGVAEALAFAHAAVGEDGRALGLVHRDVSPSNIMVGRQGLVKLLDFGIAAAGRDRGGDVGGGKYAWMAPEVARGEVATPRSDLFALGMVAWEVLTGRHPFRGYSEAQTTERIATEALSSLGAVVPGLPPVLVALVDQLLAKEPGARPADGYDVVRRLREAAVAVGPLRGLDELGQWLVELEARTASPWAGALDGGADAGAGLGIDELLGLGLGRAMDGGGRDRTATALGQGASGSGLVGVGAATEGQSLGAAIEGQGLGAATEGQGLGAAIEGQGLGAATEGQGLGAATEGRGLSDAADAFAVTTSDAAAAQVAGRPAPVVVAGEDDTGSSRRRAAWLWVPLALFMLVGVVAVAWTALDDTPGGAAEVLSDVADGAEVRVGGTPVATVVDAGGERVGAVGDDVAEVPAEVEPSDAPETPDTAETPDAPETPDTIDPVDADDIAEGDGSVTMVGSEVETNVVPSPEPVMYAVRVETEPPGARVVVSGLGSGRSPYSVQAAVGSRFLVRASLDGFEGRSQMVTVDGPEIVRFRLTPEERGQVRFRVLPADATVTLDGAPVSRGAGGVVAALSVTVGTHTLVVSTAKGGREERVFDVKAGETKNLRTIVVRDE